MSNAGKYSKLTFKLVETIINKMDPIGLLENGAPPDEYFEEIKRIIPLIEQNRDKVELGRLIYNIFVENFDKKITGDIDVYLKIAKELIEKKREQEVSDLET